MRKLLSRLDSGWTVVGSTAVTAVCCWLGYAVPALRGLAIVVFCLYPAVLFIPPLLRKSAASNTQAS